jgi:hypothetical protein
MPILDVTVGGVTTILSDGAPFAVLSADGGMADVARITERGPLQQGDSDIDFRLQPTLSTLGLIAYASDIGAHFDVRARLLEIFRPSRTPLVLRWTLENGAVRQLDCHVAGRLAFNSIDMRGFTQRCAVPLRAADPTLYDPAQVAVTYGVGGGGDSWTIPWAVPWGIGAATVDQTRTIVYAGSWRTFPVITITGPITNPVITNLTTGDKLDFTGITIAAANTYTIDLAYGRKTITNQLGANKIADLTNDSDLATFALEANPEAPGGVNSIRVTGTGATSATEIYLQYYPRYVGF